jgi:hypothetical protein
VKRWSCKIQQLIATKLGYKDVSAQKNQVAVEWVLANHNNHKERQHKRHSGLSRGSAKYNTCLPPRCGSNDQLEYHDFSLLISFPVSEESPQVGASRPYNKDYNVNTRVWLGATHTNPQHNTRTQAKTWAQMKHREFTTRTELKSLTRSIKCVETECVDLELLSECLDSSSMRLRVSFIAPRQLGAVRGQQGRQFLPSVGEST